MRVADREGPALRIGRLARVAPGTALICMFIAIELWFRDVDFYHRHFFQPGWLVAVDNLARVGFTFILFWLIYVPGYVLIAAITPR